MFNSRDWEKSKRKHKTNEKEEYNDDNDDDKINETEAQNPKQQMVEKVALKATQLKGNSGVPLWRSRLRIEHCLFSCSGCYCSVGLISGPGTSTCYRHGQKKANSFKR